jgi:hypothetical protein
MATFQSTITVGVSALLTGAPDVGSARHTVSESFAKSFTDGTGASQAKNMYVDDFTIVGAGTQTYDLAGALTNGLGAVVFTAVKAIIIENTGTGNLVYGNGSNPLLAFVGGAAHTIAIPAGGMVCMVDPTAAGQPITAGTGDILTLTGTDCAGTIIIIGETA